MVEAASVGNRTAEAKVDGAQVEATLAEWIEGASHRYLAAVRERSESKFRVVEAGEELRNALYGLHDKAIVVSGFVSATPEDADAVRAAGIALGPQDEVTIEKVIQSMLDYDPADGLQIVVHGEISGTKVIVEIKEILEIVGDTVSKVGTDELLLKRMTYAKAMADKADENLSAAQKESRSFKREFAKLADNLEGKLAVVTGLTRGNSGEFNEAVLNQEVVRVIKNIADGSESHAKILLTVELEDGTVHEVNVVELHAILKDPEPAQ